jgi:cysteine desulfurase
MGAERCYFDHNATAPVDGAVAEVFLAAARETFGNASSIHREGQAARQVIEKSRREVAAFLDCSPKEIVFTSGGTEADNLAIFGAVTASGRKNKHVVTTAVEHPAVLAACRQLEAEGVSVTYVKPGADGLVTPAGVCNAIREETALVSVMHANNELGTVHDIAAMARAAHAKGALFHSDGVQAAGKLPVSMRELGVDLYTISGHKLYAPKGAGALFVKQGVEMAARQFGGRHESGRRAGTENVAGCAALGAACGLDFGAGRMAGLPNTTNIRFAGIEGEAMVIALDLRGYAVSSGAACSSGAVEPSHVLLAMGLTKEQAKSSIRFSLGKDTTREQVDGLIEAVVAAVAHLRKVAPAYV